MARHAAAAAVRRREVSTESVVTLHSATDAQQFGERIARAMLGVSLDDAYRLLEEGKLSGTIAETELEMLRSLVRR